MVIIQDLAREVPVVALMVMILSWSLILSDICFFSDRSGGGGFGGNNNQERYPPRNDNNPRGELY